MELIEFAMAGCVEGYCKGGQTVWGSLLQDVIVCTESEDLGFV